MKVTIELLCPIGGNMPFEIVRNDITKMHVDAIVNPTNGNMFGTAGADGAIHKMEGSWLREETSKFERLMPGHVRLTPARNLPSKYIIHTVGPKWNGGGDGEEDILRCCYINALNLAIEMGFKSIAIPLIASGTFGYPKDRALATATATIGEFLLSHELDVYLVVYDRKAFVLSDTLFKNIEAYIDDHYVDTHDLRRNVREIDSELHYESTLTSKHSMSKHLMNAETVAFDKQKQRKLEDIVNYLGESFSQMLFRLIDQKNLNDPEVYKRANVSKQTFSKIRNLPDYTPKKSTVVALAISLKLNLDETKDLLQKAGYALSNNSKFDVIITYFIESGMYDIFEINEVLFKYEAELLGA